MRVIVADDSAVIRAGVVRILTVAGFEVVAEARSADTLLTAVAEHRPDLAVIDIRMPPDGNAGLHAAEEIRDRYDGEVRVLVLSQYLEPEYALRLLGPGIGGVGYLLKDRVAEGRSNRSIADRLALSVKTIEAAIAMVFSKLDLEPGPGENRRVLAVLAYLDSTDLTDRQR